MLTTGCIYPMARTLCSLSRLLDMRTLTGLRKTKLIPSFQKGWWRQYTKVLLTQGNSHTTTNDIKKFLTEHCIGFQEGYTCLVTDCQLCNAHSRGRGEVGKLYINRTTGMFVCLKCQSCGSWQDLQDCLSLVKLGETKLPLLNKPYWFLTERDREPLLQTYSEAIPIHSLGSSDLQSVLRKFKISALNEPTLEKFEVRVKSDLSQLILPIYAITGKLVGLHIANAERDNEIENFPRQLVGAMFGWKQLSKRRGVIVISSSPLDVLAITQETSIPSVSLPQEKSLPLEVLPLLEPYSKIILWLGNSVPALELSKMLARKLNDRRCFFIRPQEDHLPPLQALHQQLNISDILKSAHPIAHNAITSFHSLRHDVYAELTHTEQVAGVKWKRYPLLTKLLKGHRRGELTVFTGPTGSGKTTFMSEYSLDLCMQGVRTLWGSFEICNTRLAKMMLTQFSQIALEKSLDQYDYWADKFEGLPLYFLTFHGPQSIRSVLDAMRHAVYVHDIEHVIVDNLQFMLGTSEASHTLDRFWKQDLVVSSFRQFATVHNCHVTLVIHPRKENSDELSNMSIFGGAKASQEADNVLILQDKRLHTLRGRKYIQVTKNRFDGELGIVPLEFDRETMSFELKKKMRKTSSRSFLTDDHHDGSENESGQEKDPKAADHS